ncbi:MAG TPA: NAD-dependent epimerase/dehydratase family protein [archaeon]|nr:NAD-dependent epimerase/dehydratase family protein [archaeon]
MISFPFKKAMVTGGAGFIGGHIVEEPVRLGVETVSIDNYFAGKHENLIHQRKYFNFHEVECYITEVGRLEKYFPGVEIVFHQAASKKTICLNNPQQDLEINTGGTL